MNRLGKEEVRILKRAKNIKQVVKSSWFGPLKYVESVDLAGAYADRELRPICKARELKKLCVITTNHSLVGYKGFFKPKAFETLSQIPDEIADKVVAYRVEPKLTFDTLDKHQGRTTLYTLKEDTQLPENVKNQDVVYKNVTYSTKDIEDMTK